MILKENILKIGFLNDVKYKFLRVILIFFFIKLFK